ncbi:MAG TPA: hypothetical protein VEZ89_12365, partial [Rubrivivax sp.]|nr:hypothetical protein [Rubrivivax sp.]
MDAQRQHWLGGVQLVRPLALGWITAGVLCVLVMLAVFMTLAQYTRKATASGVLVPDRGLIRLVPSAAATVVERLAVEGQAVRAGDLLFVLALERPLLSGEAQVHVRRSLEARRRSLADAALAQQSLTGTRVAALGRRMAALETEVAQLDAEAA